MKVITPLDFRTLPWNKKVQLITVTFLSKCTTVRGGEYKKSFFPLWQHFRKQDVNQLHILYDYLFQSEFNNLMSVSELYRNSKEFAEKSKINTDVVDQYKEYSMEDLE